MCGLSVLLLGVFTLAQTPASGVNHFAKDGLSFDYPAGWQIADSSTGQMQVVQLLRGDGYAELRVRVPREWLKTPEKEAHAKKLIQDKYVDDFVETLQQNGLRPSRANATTEIAGANADGVRVRAVLDREPGGMDSFYRVISDRFVNLSELGSERDMAKSAAAWDMVRNSIKVEAAPQAKPSPQATPKPTPKP